MPTLSGECVELFLVNKTTTVQVIEILLLMTQPLQPNLLGLPYAPAECVTDSLQQDRVAEAIVEAAKGYHAQNVVPDFCHRYLDWISSTKFNRVNGLDQFTQIDYSLGTSESFDKFYLRNHGRRFRCFRGEYLYHTLAWRSQDMPWAYIDDAPIESGDAVVVSLPFADLGQPHWAYGVSMLDRCARLGVPVLLDCAFFGICANIDFDFDHAAITDICFSLSKTWPVNTLRIGMRLSRPAQDTMSIYNGTQYVNKLGAAIGSQLLALQSPDEVFQRWRSTQLEFCSTMNLMASDTVIFGIDHQHQYDQYNRGMRDTNRLCFSRYFVSGKLL